METLIYEKIALTGASGFLGSLMLKKFAELPAITEVHIFDKEPPSVASNKFIFHRLDLTRDQASSEIAEILIKNKVETFIHGALFSGPIRKGEQHHEVESIGTFHVLNAIAEAKIKKFIVQSATFVYGVYPGNPNFITETFPTKYLGAKFVKTRVDVENQIAEFARRYPECAVTVLRFAPILGPNSTHIIARYFLSSFIPKVLGYDPLLQFIHEEDALKAMLLALQSSEKGIFNIVGKGVLPLSTAIHISGKTPIPIFSGISTPIFSFGYFMRVWHLPGEMAPFLQYLCVADGKKAENILNFKAKYSTRQALKSMIEAHRLREQGFSVPSSLLGEDLAVASRRGFERIS